MSMTIWVGRTVQVTLVMMFVLSCDDNSSSRGSRTNNPGIGDNASWDAGNINPVLAQDPGIPIEPGLECPAGLTLCGSEKNGRCFDLQISDRNCGACGNVCAPGIACSAGRCNVQICKRPILFTEIQSPIKSIHSYGSVLLGDFNRDGHLDFVTGGRWDKEGFQVRNFQAKGDGTFEPIKISGALSGGWNGTVADLNHDGILDLLFSIPSTQNNPRYWDVVVTGENDTDHVEVRLGKGDGTFDAPRVFLVGTTPLAIATGDLDGDGNLDFATANLTGQTVTLWYGTGDGNFARRTEMVVNGKAEFIAIVDWNQDSIPDVVLSDGTLRLFFGGGAGVFSNVLPCGIDLKNSQFSHIPRPVYADFEGDGLWDIPNAETLLLGMVECNFSKQSTYPKTVLTPLLAEDLNGDGFKDLLVNTTFLEFPGGYRLFPGNGQGSLAAGEVVFASTVYNTKPDMIIAGDINGDGRLDLIAQGFTSLLGYVEIKFLLNTCK